jgi:hypothetical protein
MAIVFLTATAVFRWPFRRCRRAGGMVYLTAARTFDAVIGAHVDGEYPESEHADV